MNAVAIAPLPPDATKRQVKEWLGIQRTAINGALVSDMARSATVLLSAAPAITMVALWVTVTQLNQRGLISQADEVILKVALGASGAAGALGSVGEFIGRVIPG